MEKCQGVYLPLADGTESNTGVQYIQLQLAYRLVELVAWSADPVAWSTTHSTMNWVFDSWNLAPKQCVRLSLLALDTILKKLH